MARPSPLITACLGIGALVLGLEVAVIYRSHNRPPAPTAAEEPDPAPPIVPAEPPPVPPPPAPPPPAPVPPVATAAVVPAPLVGGDTPAVRPQFTSPDIETVIRTADEEVFEKLQIPDATRVAIRRLNEEHEQKLHALRAGAAGVTDQQQLVGNPANVVAFNLTRREALQEILGTDTEILFERAERAATKHLHNQLRAQALGGGVSAAASPPSVP